MYKEPALNNEFKKLCGYIIKNGLSVFPYDFFNSYFNLEIDVHSEEDFFYVIHKGKRMYFPCWKKEKIKRYYLGLLAEQDINSPHLYCLGKFHVQEGDTLIDIGAAEGFFSLDFVSIVDKVILFENKEIWYAPLNKTFAPFSNKVSINKKYVGNKSSKECIRLDDMHELYNIPLFIKIDVDGNEFEVLKGMHSLLESNNSVRIAVCTYHKQDDFIVFSDFLAGLGFELSSSQGYMLYVFDKSQKYPYFRKGVLRASKVVGE